MEHIGIHYLNTKKQARKKVKRIAKKLAKKRIAEELKKAGFDGNRPTKTQTKTSKILNKLIFFIALIGPTLTIPQILNIRIQQEAGGLSIITRGAYVVSSSCRLTYGIIQKEKAIIFSNSLRLTVNFLVFLGALTYG